MASPTSDNPSPSLNPAAPKPVRPQNGGSAGTALLTTFLARTAQTHQVQLAANVVPGSPAYQNYMGNLAAMLRSSGMSAAQATQTAVGYAYQQMLRQATMLSYKTPSPCSPSPSSASPRYPSSCASPPKPKNPPPKNSLLTMILAF